MVAKKTGPQPNLEELQRRNSLALSLIGHRKPSEHLINLIELALNGASIEDLMDVERPF